MVRFRAAGGNGGTRRGCARQTVRAVGSICTSDARAGPRGGARSPTAWTRTRGADSTAGKYTGCRCVIWGRVQITHQPDRPVSSAATPPTIWELLATYRIEEAPNRARTSPPSRFPRTSRRVRISSKSERWPLCMPNQHSKETPLASRAALIMKRNGFHRNEDMSQGHPPPGIDRPPRPRGRPLKTLKRSPCSCSILSSSHVFTPLRHSADAK